MYDILIIGGGINGAGIARDAAGRGLKTLLCEKDDLASHTSSASTKLIHGGLRYLEHYDFALVRKALMEREVVSAEEFQMMLVEFKAQTIDYAIIGEERNRESLPFQQMPASV